MFDTLRDVYGVFLRLTGALIFVFGVVLVVAGVSTIWLIPTQLQMEIATRFQGGQFIRRILGGGRRFLSSGILYLVASVLIYPPFNNRLLTGWDSATPEEPEHSHDWTTFLIVDANLPPTGFIIALLATAVLRGIPLV
jgi:hypothetical protein